MYLKQIILLWASISNVFGNNVCKNYYDYPLKLFNRNCYNNDNIMLDTESMIKLTNYQFENHQITTSDGYVLTVFRLLPRNDNKNYQPVFLLHGLFTSPSIWVFKGNNSLGFHLANQGYDVWLGTIRGISVSKKNKYYDENDARLWNFNLDTVAKNDISAQLKYIDEHSNEKGSIIFVGYSMGATLGFMYIAENSEVNHLLSGMVGLAPVVYINKIRLSPLAPILYYYLEYFVTEGQYDQHTSRTRYSNVFTCNALPYFCKMFFSLIFGPITDQFQAEDLMLYASNFPEGTSVQLLKHFVQMLRTGNFQKYDYGVQRNLAIYNQSESPKYDLSNVKLPVALFYGKNDIISTENNVKRLYQEIGSDNKSLQHIPKTNISEGFNHLDFIMAKDIEKYLFDELLHVFRTNMKLKRKRH